MKKILLLFLITFLFSCDKKSDEINYTHYIGKYDLIIDNDLNEVEDYSHKYRLLELKDNNEFIIKGYFKDTIIIFGSPNFDMYEHKKGIYYIKNNKLILEYFLDGLKHTDSFFIEGETFYKKNEYSNKTFDKRYVYQKQEEKKLINIKGTWKNNKEKGLFESDYIKYVSILTNKIGFYDNNGKLTNTYPLHLSTDFALYIKNDSTYKVYKKNDLLYVEVSNSTLEFSFYQK